MLLEFAVSCDNAVAIDVVKSNADKARCFGRSEKVRIDSVGGGLFNLTA